MLVNQSKAFGVVPRRRAEAALPQVTLHRRCSIRKVARLLPEVQRDRVAARALLLIPAPRPPGLAGVPPARAYPPRLAIPVRQLTPGCSVSREWIRRWPLWLNTYC